MYYYIQGELVLTEPGAAVIDNNGIAYKLSASANTLSHISSQKGGKIKLYTYLLVREDAMELIGFYNLEELAAFKMLISVSGVGAKSALSVMSHLSPEKFALAVTTADTKSISKAQGIGAKTAARIVLEIKDKISKEIAAGDDAQPDTLPANNNLADAQTTLLALGYTRSEALAALRGIDTSALDLENIIKAALRKLGG